MKKEKKLIVIVMLVITPLLVIQVSAHPPDDMQLDYDFDIQSLNVTINHVVSDPNDHYIYKVEIEKNSVLYDTFLYSSQPTTNSFTYKYIIEVEIGDELTVTAVCSIFGSIERSIIVTGDNQPPEIPDIDGETSGEVGLEYEYTFYAIDPDGDSISYCIDWGDNSGEVCIGPFPSGTEQKSSHTWDKEGIYLIKAKARDIYGIESDWATLEINMPKLKQYKNNFLEIINQRILYRFPLFEKILNQIT